MSDVLITALLGMAGIVATWLTAREGRAHAERMAAAERDHREQMARRERMQARRADTYVEALEMIGWVLEIANRTNPVIEPGPPPPEPPSDERVRPAQARLDAHGSPEVVSILERWGQARNEFFVASSILTQMRAANPEAVERIWGKSLHEQYTVVEDKRQELRSLAQELRDRITPSWRSRRSP